MKIELKEIPVSQMTTGYTDNAENGVTGYDGKLDIRPPYQREFIYKDKQRDPVIDTATKDYPLDIMYWAVKSDGNYEIIDGQQRTISICQYVTGDFAFNQFKDNKLDPAKLENEIGKLMQDEDVTKKTGIYAYVLTREEKHLKTARCCARMIIGGNPENEG